MHIFNICFLNYLRQKLHGDRTHECSECGACFKQRNVLFQHKVSISSTLNVRTSFQQPFSSYMYVVKAAETTFVRKIRMFNVDEIDTRWLSINRDVSVVRIVIKLLERNRILKCIKEHTPLNHRKFLNCYSVRRLIGSRIIESAAYCNQINVIPLYSSIVHKKCRLIESFGYCYHFYAGLLSSGYCIDKLNQQLKI